MAFAIPLAMGAASAIGGMASGAMSADEAARRREEAKREAEGMPLLDLPDQDYSFLDYAGDYNPYAYAKPQEAQYQTISEDPRLRDTEIGALQHLVDQGGAVGQAHADAARYGALDDANQLARGREGAIRQRMASAGQSGAGMDAIMQAQSAQSAANRARGGTLDATHMAALEKLANEQAVLGAAGNVRGQDLNTAKSNADIINRFNLFNTQTANELAARNVDNQNAGQLRNVNTRQDVSGRNTGIRNANVDRRTNNAKAEYEAKSDKVHNIVNAINGQASQASANGQVYNNIGQQGSQLFTNIGSGTAAEQARQPQSSIRVTPTDNGERGDTYDHLDIRG